MKTIKTQRILSNLRYREVLGYLEKKKKKKKSTLWILQKPVSSMFESAGETDGYIFSAVTAPTGQ